jgi:hypothetical protein
LEKKRLPLVTLGNKHVLMLGKIEIRDKIGLELENIECYWEDIKKEVIKNSKCSLVNVNILSHGILPNHVDSIKKKCNMEIGIFDYSETDIIYRKIWDDIYKSKNEDDLIPVIEYWVRNITINPIRRIKHRVINEFLSLLTDLEHIENIKNLKDKLVHDEDLQEIAEEWSFFPPIAHIERSWYMIVGDFIDNQALSNSNLIRGIPLPENRSLFEWLCGRVRSDKNIRIGENIWIKLLEHVGLQKLETTEVGPEGHERLMSFVPSSIKKQDHPLYFILRYTAAPKKIIEDENFLQYANGFYQWVSELNAIFEELVDTWQRDS